MGNPVIKVENLGKMYRLGQIGTGTLSHDLNRWIAKLKGEEDPFAKVDEVNDRTSKSNSKFAWALKDINFEVREGEVLGIIGNNGAGKSTLLKILSEITAPTIGSVKIKGKIASLLEVGTGFHPELTGRENIFLNGAILGMTKREIKSKFDEIVDFSGVERYIDTPVKRYSSGMYVRLAFAVAAHLEPEILVIDEVLAVGDSDFQKKCLGKMKEVSQANGRTILFVSHNMQAVKSICQTGLWLQNGVVKSIGEISGIVNSYSIGVQQSKLKQSWSKADEAPGNEFIRLKSIELIPILENAETPIDIRTAFTIKFELWNFLEDVALNTGLVLYSYSGECIFDLLSPTAYCQKGIVEGECHIPGDLLNDGFYYFSLNAIRDTSVPIFNVEECLSFEVQDYREGISYYQKWWGAVRPKLPYRLEQKTIS